MGHKLAIIGFGGMGGWHCQNITEKIDEITVKGVWDIREEAREKAKGQGLYAYSSLDELLNDDEIDIVTIATPNDFHKQLVIDCLEAGKNVVCEKPVALNSAELVEMIDASKRTGKLFSIHQNRRWDKDYRIIKEIVDKEMLGTPYFIESRVQGSRGAMHGWRGHKINGGGMLLDWGVHLIDQLMNMIHSPVVCVDAHLQSIFSDEVDDNIKVFLYFENGVSAVLEMATNCFINHPRWHLSCTDGTAVVEDWSCKGKMVQLNTNAEMEWADDIVYTEAGPTRTMAPRPAFTTKELPLPEVQTDWSDYYKNIVDVLDNGAELIVKPEQALRVMRVIDTAFESNAKREGIHCNI